MAGWLVVVVAVFLAECFIMLQVVDLCCCMGV